MGVYRTRAELRLAHLESLDRPLTDEESADLQRAMHAVYVRQQRQRKLCGECGKSLGRANRSGYCKPHFNARMNADPAVLQRRRVAIQKSFENPERREDRRQHMLRIRHLSLTPENIAKRDYAAMARRRSERIMAWCPEDRHDEYRRLRSHIGATAAKAQILASLTPFERQLALVASGKARIVEVTRIPSRSVEQSLIGNASALMVAA